jgi:hypothetical protein
VEADIDFIPTEHYTKVVARRAIADAQLAVSVASLAIDKSLPE